MLRVLLVCTGNICRTPIAHGLLADRSTRLLDGAIEVRSSGTWGRAGSPASPEAVIAARDLGIDIGAHRSSAFSDELAGWADLVVTMTGEQTEEVIAAAPQAEGKTFTLKELVGILEMLPPGPEAPTREVMLRRVAEAHKVRSRGTVPPPVDLDVADPLGLSPSVYRAVANELLGLIDRLVLGLTGARDPALAKEG